MKFIKSVKLCTAFLIFFAAPLIYAETPDLRQRAYYVEHSVDALIRNQRPGETLNLAAFNAEYRRRRDMDETFSVQQMQEFLRSGGQNITDLNRIAESVNNYRAGGSLRDNAQSVANIAGAVGGPAVEQGAKVFNELVNIGGRAADAWLGPGAQREAQAKLAQQGEFLHNKGRQELFEALRLADTDPAFRQAFNNYFAPLLGGIRTDTGADQILAANRTLAVQTLTGQNNQLLQNANENLLRMMADGRITADEIKDLVRSGNALTGEAAAKTEAILSLMKEQERANSVEAERQRIERELEIKRRDLQRAVNNARAAGNLISTFLGLSDPDAARVFSTASNAVINIAEAVGKFQNKDISSIIMASNILDASMAVVSLFGGGQPNPFQQISEQINSVKQMLLKMQEAINHRFERVDFQLKEIYRKMIDGFELVLQRQGDIQESVNRILSGLARTQDDIQRLREDIGDRFRALNDETNNLQEDLCLRYRERVPNTVIDFNSLYYPCMSRFSYWSSESSRNVNTIGTPHPRINNLNALEDASLMGSFNAELETYPTERLQLLSAFGVLTGNGGLQRNQKPIPSVLAWTMGAEAYLKLLGDFGRHYRACNNPSRPCYVPLNDLCGMMETGEDLRWAIRNITYDPDAARQTPRQAFWLNLIENYKRQANNVERALGILEEEYRSSAQINSNLEQLNLWGPPNQASGYMTTTYAYGEGREHLPAGRVININKELVSKIVPPQWLVAEQLNLIQIRFTWDFDYRTSTPAPDSWLEEWKKDLRGSVVIKAEMQLTSRGTDASNEWLNRGGEDWLNKPQVKWILRDIPGLDDFDAFRAGRAIIGSDISPFDKKQEDYIAANWESGANLLNRFINEARPNLYKNPDISEFLYHRSQHAMTKFVEQELNKHRRSFAQRVINTINLNSGRLADSLKNLKASRLALRRLVELGLSRSLKQNDEFAAFLYGLVALPTEEVMLSQILFAYQENFAEFNNNLTVIENLRDEQHRQLMNYEVQFESRPSASWYFPRLRNRDALPQALIDARSYSQAQYDYKKHDPREQIKTKRGHRDARADQFYQVLLGIFRNNFQGESLEEIERTMSHLQTVKALWHGQTRCPTR